MMEKEKNRHGDQKEPREASLYEQLVSYGQSDYAAFHMPGHKRQVKTASLPQGLPWQIDITEIDGFDNLHHAEGILKASMEKAASAYGVRKTLYSINGSTAGILSAVFAVTRPGDTILMGRNCHKSVYHAVFLRGIHPLYLYPQIEEATGIGCGYSPEELKRMLITYPAIRAVILTSPTYEGAISDIKTMAELTHERGIPLIVDEAHGAHLAVNEEEASITGFPVSAVKLGADLVIQSLHKTLPALTQTALLHICGNLADEQEAARYMSIFQTSSPSYVLMASIDSCLRYRMSQEGLEESRRFCERLRQLRDKLSELDHIHLVDFIRGQGKGQEESEIRNQAAVWDPSKLVIMARGMTGRELYDVLREKYHLQPEMCTGKYTLLMTSLFDTEEMYDRLYCALKEMDKQYTSRGARQEMVSDEEEMTGKTRIVYSICRAGRQVWIPAEADLLEQEEIALKDSAGRISAEYAYQYPPGIPLLVPGEEISEEILNCLMKEKEAGMEIQGMKSMTGQKILVIRG